MLGAPPQMLVFAGGHIHRRIGAPMTRAGTKKPIHRRRHDMSAQKKDSATTVPYACTWKTGVTPATTPAKTKGRQLAPSRTASQSTTSRMRARLKTNSVER